MALGLYMIWGGATKATSKPYYFLLARASLLWKNKAHQFLVIFGILVVTIMAYLSFSW